MATGTSFSVAAPEQLADLPPTKRDSTTQTPSANGASPSDNFCRKFCSAECGAGRIQHVVVLAAGYGTRLTQDIRADVSGKYAHLAALPKGLLPIGDIPLLDHWIRKFEELGIHNIKLICNTMFCPQFRAWSEKWRGNRDHHYHEKNTRRRMDIEIVDNGTSTNETRRGAIADMYCALQRCGIVEEMGRSLVEDTSENYCKVKKVLEFAGEGTTEECLGGGTGEDQCSVVDSTSASATTTTTTGEERISRVLVMASDLLLTHDFDLRKFLEDMLEQSENLPMERLHESWNIPPPSPLSPPLPPFSSPPPPPSPHDSCTHYHDKRFTLLHATRR